jgi:GNAT superfamily N-acetyltransferase
LALSIRPATRSDLPLIAQFIRDLAEYERLAHEVRFDEAELGARLFGARPFAEVLIGEIDRRPQGFALFFHNFSTFEGKPGVYLEDLFVRPEARGFGLGKALLSALAQIAVERECARLEWSVLDWNEPAIGFYKSLEAKPLDEWTVFRVDGEALSDLAQLAKNASLESPADLPVGLSLRNGMPISPFDQSAASPRSRSQS